MIGFDKEKVMTGSVIFCSFSSVLLLVIALSTNSWMYALESKEWHSTNGTQIRVDINTYSGLWKVCALNGLNVSTDSRCPSIKYFMPGQGIPGEVKTTTVLRLIQSSVYYPCAGLGVMIIATTVTVFSFLGNRRKHLTLIGGIIFVCAGLCLVSGLIQYVTSINDALSTSGPNGDTKSTFIYQYGYSFFCGVLSFILSQTAGVLCVYLYVQRQMKAEKKEKERQAMKEQQAEVQRTGVARNPYQPQAAGYNPQVVYSNGSETLIFA